MLPLYINERIDIISMSYFFLLWKKNGTELSDFDIL